MPKGLLPSLKEKLNQKLRPQKQEAKESNPVEEITNLGLTLEPYSAAARESKNAEIISLLQKTIILILFIYVVLIAANNILATRLEKLKSDQNTLARQVFNRKATQDLALKVGKETAYYQSVLTSRKLLSPKMAFLLNNTNPGITINYLSLRDSNFDATLYATSPFAFTKLVMDYLQGNMLSEIVLREATMNVTTKAYSVSIGGNFK